MSENKRRGQPANALKEKSAKEKQTRVPRVFAAYPELNRAYSAVRKLIIAHLEEWNRNNPELEAFKAFDLYITAYLHYCIPHGLMPNPLYSDTKTPQRRLVEIINPLIDDNGYFTQKKYSAIISENKNIDVFLNRLTASRTFNSKEKPYIIPGSKTTFKDLYDAGYIKEGDKIVLRTLGRDHHCVVDSNGRTRIEVNGKIETFDNPGDAGRNGIKSEGFDQWKLAYVLQKDGSRKVLREYRKQFENDKPFPEHFDSISAPVSEAPQKPVQANPANFNDDDFYEGSIKRISIEVRERDAGARKACIEQYGAKCFICKFDFGQFYGPEAEGFIHVHHREKLSGRKGTTKTDPVKDLVPLCPNCHSVLHLRKDAYEVEEVKAMVVRQRLMNKKSQKI